MNEQAADRGPDTIIPDVLRWRPDATRPVRVKQHRLRADSHVVPHRHAWGQVAWSASAKHPG